VSIEYRRLEVHEVARVGEIDRSERITSMFTQHGERLEECEVDDHCPAWFDDGESEHTVAHQRAACERYLQEGSVALGAFIEERLVGIGIVRPHIRPHVAQLAFLHVSNGMRGRGVGVTLNARLEDLARSTGAAAMVVSATPSGNTVRFYLRRGYAPTAEPLPELLELEPEDVHMRKSL
jgi:predicted N-acetyltransferase YhbS